jgi:hypothetical protein
LWATTLPVLALGWLFVTSVATISTGSAPEAGIELDMAPASGPDGD